MAHILIVDKDRDIWDYFGIMFSKEHFMEFLGSVGGIDKRINGNPDIAFLDFKTMSPDVSETISSFHQNNPNTMIHVMTEYLSANLDEIDKIQESGVVFDVCRKPLKLKEIQMLVKMKINSLAC